MNGLSCNNCGATIHESDVFCRRCGAKRQASGAEYEAGFCPKCGNVYRDGARFCDMCGEEFPSPKGGGNIRPQIKRGRRRRKGCLRKLLLLILLMGIAGAAITHRHTLRPIVEEFVARHLGALRHTVVSRDTEQEWFPVASRDEEENAGVREVTSPDRERDEEDLNGPASGDIVPEEAEEPLVIAVPETEEPADVSPDLPVSPDFTASPDLSVSGAEGEEISSTAEVVWTERDQDGYSFLSGGDRFEPDGEVLSVRGVVSGDQVNVRDRPSIRGNRRRQFNNGTSVDVTGRFASGEEKYYWFRIRRAREIGWIYGEFLQVESTDSAVEDVILQAGE